MVTGVLADIGSNTGALPLVRPPFPLGTAGGFLNLPVRFGYIACDGKHEQRVPLGSDLVFLPRTYQHYSTGCSIMHHPSDQKQRAKANYYICSYIPFLEVLIM